VGNAHTTWSDRASCIITLKSDTERGQGEAAPLPDFSPDGLRIGEQALAALDLREIPTRLAPNQDLIGELRRASVRIPPHLPAARAALEAALLDLWSRAAAVPAWKLLLPVGAKPVARPVAALLSGDPEQARAQAIAARERGIETFKFKIGRPGARQRELVAVQGLRASLGAQARLRLDANQAWHAAQAREYLPSFAASDLEFIEEPCPQHELTRLDGLGLPLALDESLATGARPRPGQRAVILKPTLLGGVTACVELAEAARAVGAEVILSHAFEGPLGLGLSAALALSIGSERLAHGLDPEGAHLEQLSLPWYSEAAIRAWSEPGFGIPEQP